MSFTVVGNFSSNPTDAQGIHAGATLIWKSLRKYKAKTRKNPEESLPSQPCRSLVFRLRQEAEEASLLFIDVGAREPVSNQKGCFIDEILMSSVQTRRHAETAG